MAATFAVAYDVAYDVAYYKLFMMGCDLNDIVSRARTFSGHTNQFKINGKVFVSSYAGDCLGNGGCRRTHALCCLFGNWKGSEILGVYWIRGIGGFPLYSRCVMDFDGDTQIWRHRATMIRP